MGYGINDVFSARKIVIWNMKSRSSILSIPFQDKIETLLFDDSKLIFK